MGARPMTSISTDSMRTESRSSKRSRTTARGITSGAQPPSAWTKRKPTSVPTFGATAQPSEPATNSSKTDEQRRTAAVAVGQWSVNRLPESNPDEIDAETELDR